MVRANSQYDPEGVPEKPEASPRSESELKIWVLGAATQSGMNSVIAPRSGPIFYLENPLFKLFNSISNLC
jgi:hypothetical protein